MINGIFTRYRTETFVSGVSGTSTIFTTTVPSLVFVEFQTEAGNNNITVFWDEGGLQVILATCGATSTTANGTGGFVPASEAVRISRQDANVVCHIFELE